MNPRDVGFALAAHLIEGKGAGAIAEKAPRGASDSIKTLLQTVGPEGLAARVKRLEESGGGAAVELSCRGEPPVVKGSVEGLTRAFENVLDNATSLSPPDRPVRVEVARDGAEDAVREAALAEEGVQRAIDGKEIRRVIVVPNRIVNVVV